MKRTFQEYASVLGVAALVVSAIPAFGQESNPLNPPAPPAPPATTPAAPAVPDVPSVPTYTCSLLGVYPTSLSAEKAKVLGVEGTRGAYIMGVVEKTGAERAGLKEKDIIVQFSGKAVTSDRDLRKYIRSTAPGTMVPLEIIRDGKHQMVSAEITNYTGGCDNQVHIELGNMMKNFKDFKDMDKQFKSFELNIPNMSGMMGNDDELNGLEQQLREAENELRAAEKDLRTTTRDIEKTPGISTLKEPSSGLELQKLNGQLGKFFRVPDGNGALVSEVSEGSPAAQAGMEAGDVIVQAGGEKVLFPSDFAHAASKADGSLELKIIRAGLPQTVTLRFGSAPQNEGAKKNMNVGPDIGYLHQQRTGSPIFGAHA